MSVKVRWKDRKNGRVYFLDIHHDGRRKKVNIPAKDLKEAKRAAAQVERELMAEGWSKASKSSILLSKFTALYLTYSRSSKAHNTSRTDANALFAFQRIIGDLQLDKITADHIERFRTESLKRIKPSSVNVALRHLKAAFAWALRNRHIRTNPAAKVRLMRVPRNTHMRYLNESEIARLRDAIGEDIGLRRVVDFALWTGLRRDEIVHLQWSDISFEQRTVTVQNKSDFRTKSGKSRVVPMNPPLIAMLTGMYTASQRPDDSVFATNYWTVGIQFRKAVKRAGLEGHVSLHMLRHTFASHLIMAGVDLRSVQEMLGHSDISVTQIYSHLSPGHLAGTVAKLPY